MTAYHIISFGTATATNLISRNGTCWPLFDIDTGSNNSLTVDEGAFLNSTGGGQDVRLGAHTGAWTVTVNGQIISDGDDAIFLLGTNAATLGPQSKITIGKEGSLHNNHAGLRYSTVLATQALALTNNGTITNAAGGAINFENAGSSSLVNTGTITATGSDAAVSALSASAFSLTNSGTIRGSVNLGNGTNNITTTGNIFGSVTTGLGNDWLPLEPAC